MPNLKSWRSSTKFKDNYEEQTVSLMEKFGPKYGVKVERLENGGEPYHNLMSLDLVPEGKVRVRVSANRFKSNLSGFWGEVNKAQLELASKETMQGTSIEFR